MKKLYAVALIALLNAFCGLSGASAQTAGGLTMGGLYDTGKVQPCAFDRNGTNCDPFGTYDASGNFFPTGLPVINAAQYGVSASATATVNANALASSITACVAASSTGCEIQLPAGRFLVLATTLTLPSHTTNPVFHLTLRGAGPDASTLYFSSGGDGLTVNYDGPGHSFDMLGITLASASSAGTNHGLTLNQTGGVLGDFSSPTSRAHRFGGTTIMDQAGLNIGARWFRLMASPA